MNSLNLIAGSSIAVVGGGPSGSLFSYFALKQAVKYGLDISIDLFEAKDFNCLGSVGCNHCGGIISESLIQLLSDEGIDLPVEVIRKEIDSYTLHFEQGSTVIDTPFNEQKIAAIYRGLGPIGCNTQNFKSFDKHLLELSESKGVNIIYDRVKELERKENGIIIRTNNRFEKKYDLVVGAVGLNQSSLELFQGICPSLEVPETTRTYICEIQFGEKIASEYFGNSMHVFLLNIPHIHFGALIPKGSHITMVLLGEEINSSTIESFLKSKEVRKCFPPNTDIEKLISCRCYPSINVKGSRISFADRLVLIGDSATSKLFKDGIGAAYLTARAAANTVIYHGISERHFKKYFDPICNHLRSDNRVGKFIFSFTSIIQKSKILKSAMLRVIIKEQEKSSDKRKMSAVLWDTFTGSAPYKDILLRILNPVSIIVFMWNAIGSVRIKLFKPQMERIKSAQKKHPIRSRNIYTDIKFFFINKPPIKTLITFENDEERLKYCSSILQRTSIGVDNYKMLNIHQIGINAPISYLFEELLKWDGNSSCWPNHIAKVNLVDNRLEQIKIYLFNMSKYFFGLKVFHLFDLNAIKIQRVPSLDDPDNARYLLYECKGGYPIGVFSMYARTSIPERGENDMSQLFIMVGFDFYGNASLTKLKFIRKTWAFFHNRVTTNVAYLFKKYCEYKFDLLKNGE